MTIMLQSKEEIERQIDEYRKNTRDYHRIAAKKRRNKKGMCSRCGNTNNDKKHNTCTKCRIKTREQYKNNKSLTRSKIIA